MRLKVLMVLVLATVCRPGAAEDWRDFANGGIPSWPKAANAKQVDELIVLGTTVASAKQFLADGRVDKARELLSDKFDWLMEDDFTNLRALQLADDCDGRGSRCWRAERKDEPPEEIYLAPFRAASPDEAARDVATCYNAGRKFALLPVGAAGGAYARTVSQWRDLAERKKVFACKESYCVTIIKPTPSKIRSSDLAACLIPKVGNRFGAPSRCTKIFEETGEDGPQLLAVIGRMWRKHCKTGRPDFGFVIQGAAPDQMANFLAKAQQALVASPLSLDAEIHTDYVLGVSDHRLSSILSGYRELVTVRIDAHAWTYSIESIVSTDLLVNKQNTSRSSDWHAPSEEQQEKLNRTVKTLLKNELFKMCSKARWIDDRTLDCS
jgi:hypothetical protein